MKPWITRIIKSQLKQISKLSREMSAAVDIIPDERAIEISYELPEKIAAITKNLMYLKGKLRVENNADQPNGRTD